MGTDIRSGTQIKVGVNTDQALAELRELAAAGDRARASTAGLPSPPGTVPASTSPRLPAMPRTSVGGGRGGATLAKANVQAASASRLTKRSQEVLAGSVPVHIPTTPGIGAAGAAAAGPKSKMFLTPGASSESSLSAWAQHKKRVARSFEEGIKFEAEGLRAGVLTVGQSGASLQAAWTRTIGPLMGYAAVAYAGLKVAEAGSEALFSAIEEAANTGRTVGQVVRDTFPTMVKNTVRGGAADLLDVLEAVAGPARTAVLGQTALIGLATGAPGSFYRKLGLQKEYADNAAAETIAKVRGSKRLGHGGRLSPEAQQQYTAAIELSQKQADEDKSRVAQQLAGMGFPGTLDSLKGHIHEDIWAKYQRDLDRLKRDMGAEDAVLNNAKHGQG